MDETTEKLMLTKFPVLNAALSGFVDGFFAFASSEGSASVGGPSKLADEAANG